MSVRIHDRDVPIGTKLFIINAGQGAWGCNRTEVIIHKNQNITNCHGLGWRTEGSFVVIAQNDNSVWRICPPTENDFYIVNDLEVELC